MKVIIIGGGVVGLCCAYYLNKAGYEVTIIDRNDINQGCSFGNMGYISPSHFIPIATPGIIRQGLRWMMNSGSPFYIKPRLNIDLIRWGLAFRRAANKKTVNENSVYLNHLLQLSRELMSELNSEFPGKFNMLEKGCWALYKSGKTGEHEKELAEQATRFGLKVLICNQQEVQDHEPEVEVDVAGGVLYKDDCHLDPAAFMRTLYYHLLTTGVKFWINCSVEDFEISNGEVNRVITDKADIPCDQLVVANGSWMAETARKLGVKMLMQPGKGYSIQYQDLGKNLVYPSILIEHRTATSPLQRSLRIGGTMELSGHNDKILPGRVRAIYLAVKKYYPGIELPVPDPARAWFGYRPVSPDGMPYIGEIKNLTNTFFAGGHAMLGLSAAAATGKIIEELVSRKPTSVPVGAFDPGRFN